MPSSKNPSEIFLALSPTAETQTAIPYFTSYFPGAAAPGELKPSLEMKEYSGRASQTFITSPATFWMPLSSTHVLFCRPLKRHGHLALAGQSETVSEKDIP